MTTVATDREQARANVFASLTCCPCCAAEIASSEMSESFQWVEFQCRAAFSRMAGASPMVSETCPAGSYVALASLEREARLMAEQAVAS